MAESKLRTLSVDFAGKKYVISCMKVGNEEIEINGEEYSLRKSNPVISEKKEYCGLMAIPDKARIIPSPIPRVFIP